MSNQLVSPPEPELNMPPRPTRALAEVAPHRRSPWGIVAGIVIGAVVLLGGTYAAARFGYISLPFPIPGAPAEIIAKSLDAWYNAPASESTTEVRVVIEPRDPSIPTMFPETNIGSAAANVNSTPIGLGEANLQSAITSFDIIPDNLSVTTTTTAYNEKTTGGGRSQSTTKFQASFGSTKMVANAEVRLLEQALYLNVSQLEGVPGIDPTKVLGQWIVTNLSEVASLAPVTGNQNSGQAIGESRQAVEQVLTLAQQQQLFRVKKNYGSETINGTATRHTGHTLDPNRVIPFAEAWIAAREKAGQDVTSADDLLATLKKAETKIALESLAKALKVDLWYDASAKMMKKMGLRLVVIPPRGSVKFKDSQFTVTITATMNSVGQKKTIDVPSPTEPLESIFDALIPSNIETTALDQSAVTVNENTNFNVDLLVNTSINLANPDVPIDTDGDGLDDVAETTLYISDPTKKDTDDDGLDDATEVACQTKPAVADSDGDGYADKTEIENGYNPSGPGKATSTLCQDLLSVGR